MKVFVKTLHIASSTEQNKVKVHTIETLFSNIQVRHGHTSEEKPLKLLLGFTLEFDRLIPSSSNADSPGTFNFIRR